ncbi:MAG: 23S rRNA (adenine(2030)-N(6))-methyltransferase RlmJ [Methanothrix sp.]|uniref:23S rRNA (adenine(2030)-N(6))-methyltransferase RlmJ n=1 Tax=Methanothrix sp. TaxID=90426 RepID=UPI0025D28BA6|nr:23S rRNA (adenine(2030)-N(6))-methyltransferase RlmJ [Methanothrix sp.]MCQ8903625.1 23S rRNA (adenine(2030)-N(6))-methyltransferase RlmJ [Methanothrix sp.]
MTYDHREHAGNAGDLWKHFLLSEAAAYLLSISDPLVYAESHVGYPEYRLAPDGEWRGGIGRCWHARSWIKSPYFAVLEEMNADRLLRYPGSAQIVLRLGRALSRRVLAELWDVSEDVEKSWSSCPDAHFHLGDGFAGVMNLLKRSEPGLLLIDPPYPEDHERAIELLKEAEDRGWVAMSWHIMDSLSFPECVELHPLVFHDAGLEGGRWMGCIVAVSSDDASLRRRLRLRAEEFRSALRSLAAGERVV